MIVLDAPPAIVAPAAARITGALTPTGFAPDLRIEGLAPGASVRVEVFRLFSGWERGADGGWYPVPKLLRAWGDFIADRGGRVRPALIAPRVGSYAGVDAYGLFWSGRLVAGGSAPAASGMRINEARVVATVAGTVVAQAPWALTPPAGLRIETIEQGALNGTFAAPADGRRRPALILLHGSEGGDRDAARDIATRFAGQGYAAFALNYFAWDLKKLTGVPNAHVNQPIELLERVRDWLAARPEADVARIGLYGHSKGAEYAEVAAAHLPWVRAVVGCVPTDAVWEGYGIGDERNRTNSYGAPPALMSSFSWRGAPLPYIPLGGDRSPYRSNTDFYEARRHAYGAAVAATLIPVERSRAHFLWIAGDRDEVWASGAMARRLDARLRRAGGRSELHAYAGAGHGICSDGSYPTRLWAGESADPRDPDRDAEGRATVDAWNRIKTFLKRRLGT